MPLSLHTWAPSAVNAVSKALHKVDEMISSPLIHLLNQVIEFFQLAQHCTTSFEEAHKASGAIWHSKNRNRRRQIKVKHSLNVV